MKTIITILLIVLIGSISCKKYKTIQSDVENDLYINGRLFIRDSINDNGLTKPLRSETLVKLTYKSDTAKILYTAKTNAEGYFVFENLTKDTEYTISAEAETGTGEFKATFSATDTIKLNLPKADATPLLLFNNSKQNGVLYTIKDNASNGLISNCNVCFFSSQQLAQRDTCDYGLFTVASNTNGLVLKTNLSPGRYYVLFKKQAGSLLLKANDVIDILPSGIIRREINLF